jgi:hypothetical protein
LYINPEFIPLSSIMATFNFSYAPGTTLQQMVGFETAGRIWSAYLTDAITINLHVGVSSSMPTGVIGGALPGVQAKQQYSTWRSRLAGDITSADDQSAFQNQQNDTDKFTALINDYKVDNNYTLNMTRANAKALGMLSASENALDGYIVFSDLSGSGLSWNYDYTRQTPAPANSLDFLSTAIHEIGHVLGFVSGLDKPGWLTQSTQYDASHQSDFYNTLIGKLGDATSLDMFRFSAQSVQRAGASDTWIDMSIGNNPYFSVDGGETSLGSFAKGKNISLGGDGMQASHWKNNTAAMMAPTLAAGTHSFVSTLDLRAMDVIGWNLASNATTLTLDLSALVGQSQQALAQKLGQTVSWMNANATLAAQTIDQDLSSSVATMVQNSQVYNWGTSWYNPYRQVTDMMSRQEIYTSFQTITSLCSCSMCCQPTNGQPTNPGFSEAISSGARMTGWLGSGQPDGVGQMGRNEVQIAPTQQANHAIRQVAHAIVRNEDGLNSFGQDRVQPALNAARIVEISGTQPFYTGSEGSQSNEEQNPWAKGRSHYYNSVIRRYPETLQRSDNPQSFEESFEAI